MFRTFRGTSMGEFHNSAKRLVYGVCVDTQRRAKTISKHTAPLHATGDNGEFTDGFTPSVNKAAAREHDARDADERDADNIADLAAVFDQALATMTPANRSVMELQRDGLTTDEICEKLNMSPEAVYQNTSRGTKAILKFAEAQNA
jgi:RNA polymerase sigma factor (sigma-70 family)